MKTVEADDPVETTDLERFLWAMAGAVTSTPTLPQLVEAVAEEWDANAVAGFLEGAIEAGLVDVMEDYGPETLFILSALAANRMNIRLTYDSRRWRYVTKLKLVGELRPGESRKYFPKRNYTEDTRIELHHRVDVKQPEPLKVLTELEAAEAELDKKRHPYDQFHLPKVTLLYGITQQWPIEKRPDGLCAACIGKKWPYNAYCVECDKAGAEKFLPKVAKVARKQMPRYTTSLKGGV